MMLIQPRGVGGGPQGVALDTARGNPIPNEQGPAVTDEYVELARRSHRSLLASPLVRGLSRPSSRYNCHGLVFGSRRTNIPPAGFDDSDLIDWILSEDGFHRVSEDIAREGGHCRMEARRR